MRECNLLQPVNLAPAIVSSDSALCSFMVSPLWLIQSAVTWLCFTWDSERIITASKDGSIRIWFINGEGVHP